MYSACIDVGFVCLLLLAFTNPLAGDQNTCRYGKQRGYYAADCSNLNLWSMPSLTREIEALDLSNNRLRQLYNNTFKCCTSIKFLYLHVNTIIAIEAGTFQALTDLNVLDLSWNAFLKFPPLLPPTLRRLYLDGLTAIFTTPVSITYLKNLEFMSISNCDLNKFPSFGGSIPNLIELNMTLNPLQTITTDDLAPLCQLKYLHVTPNLFESENQLCDCRKLENWSSTYAIQVSSFKCKLDKTTSSSQCDLKPSNVTLAKREACLVELKNRQIPYLLMIGGGILAAVICISILIYVRYRRRQRASSGKNGNERTSAMKYDDNKGDENGVNPAFNGFGGGRGVETTV